MSDMADNEDRALESSYGGWTFTYDPKPARTEPIFKEGATKGYVVMQGGWLPEGEAMIGDVVALADADGVVSIEQTSEMRPTRIVE